VFPPYRIGPDFRLCLETKQLHRDDRGSGLLPPMLNLRSLAVSPYEHRGIRADLNGERSTDIASYFNGCVEVDRIKIKRLQTRCAALVPLEVREGEELFLVVGYPRFSPARMRIEIKRVTTSRYLFSSTAGRTVGQKAP
jgi:hypothetical protein